MSKKILLLAVISIMMATAAYADTVDVAQSITVHQGWEKANDIHFVVYPKEPWTGIIDWQMNIYDSPPYFYTVDSVYSDYTGEWKLHWLRFHVKFAGIIPYCDSITINVKLLLDTANAIVIDSIYWTLDGQKLNEEPKFDFPGQGFSVDNISPTGLSTVWFRNMSDEALVIRDLRLAKNQPEYLDPSVLNQFSDWTDAVASFPVMPNSFYAVPLKGMQPGAYLYMSWGVYKPGNGPEGDIYLGASSGVHEDQMGASPLNVEEYGMLDEVKFLDVSAYLGYSTIHYYLPKSTQVNLSVYAVTGELVATLVNEEQSAGGHTLRWEGDGLPAGLYIARLSADGIQAAEKIVRIK